LESLDFAFLLSHRVERRNALAARMSKTRSPDSPVHSRAAGPVVARSNTPWMLAFQVACRTIGGQMLPVVRRSFAMINAKDVTTPIKIHAEKAGESADGPVA
jgi:hypothetical protein